MKYQLDILIKAPLKTCIEKFDTTENLKHWQRGFVSAEHISGTPRAFGSKMKMHFKIGSRRIPLIETITYKNLPNAVHGIYTTKGLDNIQENYFEATTDNCTKWISVNEFVPLNFKMLLLVFLMPKTFKKQTLLYMKDYKNFVEKGISVSHA
ncbi:MAG TPA: SRPBCC family protein [Gelidibacter sp.]|uniref:SRPBCC family protein n=1 Tax=Gelidibacter sp. TaxID=2018083 RepID=UPI002B93243F|nr:SRPBCC family protein [Gelidibacter sp.]HXJ99663.1 SRPBCC family protein [Gelidibacter sp.]